VRILDKEEGSGIDTARSNINKMNKADERAFSDIPQVHCVSGEELEISA
jgi:hypothetical protein